MRYITIALAKGRLAKKALEIFEHIGVTCDEMKDENTRKLIFTNEELGIRFFLAKPSDVPTYVEYGAADIGIVGKDTLLEAIENSLVTACKNHFGSSDNVKVSIDPETCEFHVFQEKTVVETVEDPVEQISLVNAKMINSKYEIGDVVNIEVQSKEFGRIATQNAKNVILQKIREEERKVL